MLTDEGDVVLDIFGGSNTTGFAAEALARAWLTFEQDIDYATGSILRFLEGQSVDAVRCILKQIKAPNADVMIENAVCSLGKNGDAKEHSRTNLGSLATEAIKMALLEDPANYKPKGVGLNGSLPARRASARPVPGTRRAGGKS